MGKPCIGLTLWMALFGVMASEAPGQWSYEDWNPDGEYTTLDGIVFDSTIHCGNGQNFVKVGEDHYRFRARVAERKYTWYYNFRAEFPEAMIGETITLEVADINRGGADYLERAAVYSLDGSYWSPIGEENIDVCPWTPTGYPEIDNAYGDPTHVPHGVQYEVEVQSTEMWFATPTPYTLQQRDALLDGMAAAHPDLVQVTTLGDSYHSPTHGYPIRMARVTAPGDASERENIFIMSGEHCSETAGIYACDGWMREVLEHPDWLEDYAFYFVPIVNVDGVYYGATYYNMPPNLTDGPGVNLSPNWPEYLRTEPEVQAMWPVLEQLEPVFFASLHNGCGRTNMDVLGPDSTGTEELVDAWRDEVGFGINDSTTHGYPTRAWAVLYDEGITELAYTIETLLIHKQAGFDTYQESYAETGRQLARGTINALNAREEPPPQINYSESFPNDTGVDIALDNHISGWHARYELNPDEEVLNPSGKISGREAKISRYPGPDGAEGGYVYLQAKDAWVDTDTEFVVYVQETLDRTAHELTSMTWEMKNDYADTLARVAVCIDDAWYVSDETFSQSSTWAEQEFDFTDAADAWRSLDFDMAGGPGSDIEVGDLLSADLPGGDITRFGLYFLNNGGNMLIARVDDFNVGSVPSLEGDLSGDGFVGGDDLDIVRSFWGQSVTEGDLLQGDASGDGFVGGDDLDIVRANWGQGTPPAPASVPVPSTAVLLMAGAFFLTAHGIRKRSRE